MNSRRRVNSTVMRLLLFFALVVVIGAASLRGEVYGSSVAQKRSGIFRGVIVDANGKRIPGASVTVEGPDLKREITPNREAYFEIELPVGTYKITVTKSGYVTYQLTNLEIKSGGEFSHVFKLEPSRVQSAIRPQFALAHATHNKSLDRSGGCAFCIIIGPARLE